MTTKVIQLFPTNRGFHRGEFLDHFGDRCSIQRSSMMDVPLIWLGCDHERFDHQGVPCGARMHLTQEHAAMLIPMLQCFVDTGELPEAP